jgi:hypothetical protein
LQSRCCVGARAENFVFVEVDERAGLVRAPTVEKEEETWSRWRSPRRGPLRPLLARASPCGNNDNTTNDVAVDR